MTIEELNRFLDHKIETALRPIRERVDKLEKEDVISNIDIPKEVVPQSDPQPPQRTGNETPKEFLFDDKNCYARTKAAIVLKILNNCGRAMRTREVWGEMKKYAAFADSETQQTATDYLELLIKAGFANRPCSRVCAPSRRFGSDYEIAEAMRPVPISLLHKARMNRNTPQASQTLFGSN